MIGTSWIGKLICLGVLVSLVGTLVPPELLAQSYSPYGGNYGQGPLSGFRNTTTYGTESAGVGRSLGGAAGLAGGAFAGTALASSIIAAAGGATGALVGLPGIIVTSCVVAALGLIGAKLGSRIGAWTDKVLGPDTQWMLFGASVGAMLGLMFLPAMPFAGAMAPILKVMIGGFAGGILGKLFWPKLQASATPKIIFAGLGGLVGGLGFGIPGILAGSAAGFVMGGLFDRNLLSDPRRSTMNDLGLDSLVSGVGGLSNWLKNRVADITDWVQNKSHNFQARMNNNYYSDPYYGAAYSTYPSDFSVADQRYSSPEYYQTYYPSYNTNYSGSSNLYDQKQNYNNSYQNFIDSMQSGNRYQQNQNYNQYQNQNQYYRNGLSGW